jgi:2-polyprenyl-3-methyl-5-hydroxy-6-metoxy-1,4-benzoquinol methylase
LKEILKKSNCPLCSNSNNVLLSQYPGEFLSCNELHSCPNCELIFAFEQPSEKDLNNYYSNDFYSKKITDPFKPSFLELGYRLSLTRLDLIKKNTSVLNQQSRVLDVGAGNASFGRALHSIRDDAIYDAVEVDSDVRARYDSQINTHYKFLTEINRSDYDLISINNVLEHITDPAGFIGLAYKLLKDQGYIFIEVPYRDNIYKSSLEPHILFWTKNSLSFLLETTGFKMIFCDTAGMSLEKAKSYFHFSSQYKKKSFFDKILDPVRYANLLNKIINNLGRPSLFNTFKILEADHYGGERYWLRCIAQKTN